MRLIFALPKRRRSILLFIHRYAVPYPSFIKRNGNEHVRAPRERERKKMTLTIVITD